MEAKNDRIQLRIQPEVKRLLREAVAASHTTLSDLVSQAAQARAVEILTERDRIALSPKAAQTFADALSQPSAVNARLAEALGSPQTFQWLE